MLTLANVDLKRGDHLVNPYPPGWEKSTVAPGKSGEYTITRYTVTPKEIGLFNLRLIRDGYPRRIVPPGEYTRLSRLGDVIMTDTPAEAYEHNRLLHHAKGKVLLNGLGLGWALETILRKPEVEQVTVIELSKDIIKLVAPHFKADGRVKIIHADALKWRPGKHERYDAVWHDIWPDICGDNKPEMTKLKRAYGRRTHWQSAWSEEYMEGI